MGGREKSRRGLPDAPKVLRRISEGVRVSRRNREIDIGMTGRHFAGEGCNGVWKTKAAIEENVSLPSGSARKGKVARREGEAGGSQRTEKIETDRKKRVSEVGRKRRRETHRSAETRREKRQNRRNGSAGLSRTSFIFSPRLNIKDNLIIGGFSKAGRVLPLVSLLPPFSVFTSVPSSPLFVALSVDGISLKV